MHRLLERLPLAFALMALLFATATLSPIGATAQTLTGAGSTFINGVTPGIPSATSGLIRIAAPGGASNPIKVAGFMYMYIWYRGTFPRYRFDQLMQLGWKVMIPGRETAALRPLRRHSTRGSRTS